MSPHDEQTMPTDPTSDAEERRLAVLHSFAILDTPEDPEYVDPVRLAAEVCSAPLALITFIDRERVWIKARVGITVTEIARKDSFCHLILASGTPVVVEDTAADPRISASPMVTGPVGVRFYAGVPLISHEGEIIGTICVLDRVARTLTPGQQEALGSIGRLVMSRLELRRSVGQLERVIADRRKTGEGLEIREQQLRTLIETAGEGITFSDERGHFEVFNAKMEEITGYTIDEANAAEDFSRLLYPEEEDHQRALDGLKELLARGTMREVETTIRTNRGEPKTLLVSTTIVRMPSRTMFLSLYHDITERMRAERAAQEHQKRFRVMFESNPLPSWVFDYDSLRFLEVNEAMVRHYGYTREELLTMEISEIRPPEELPRLTNVLREIRFRPAFHTQMRHRAKDGRQFDVQISWNTFWYEERRAVLVVAEDISEQNRRSDELVRAMEAAEQANRTKTEFLAAMSHELRTPLNGVIGTTSLLMETTLTPEQREYTETIRASGVALLTIINDILTLARLEGGGQDPEISPVHPEETVETVMEMFGAEAESKGLELLVWVDAKVPTVIRTDGTRLRQVLVHLVSNGIKFTDRGHVAVAVSVKRRTTEVTELEFAVSDTGIGIPAERLDRIFKPFSQGDMSSTRRFGGTGLGLAIASKTVELLGGRIRVETVPGRGSTFAFTMPVVAAATTTTRFTPLLTGKEVWALAADPLARTILQKLFAGQGALVHTASSEDELRELAVPDAVIDAMVIEEGMTAVVGDLRARFKRAIPAVALCFPLHRAEVQAALAPPFLVLTKPFRHAAIVSVVADLISGVPLETGHAQAAPAKPVPLRILVAEDNAVNQKLMLRMLRNIGYEADMASNGLEVLDAVRRRRYDVVFMDVHMPELDGISATRQVRESLPPSEQPRIIAMTAYVDDDSRQRCRDAGMDEYLAKPILIEDVRNAISRITTPPSSGFVPQHISARVIFYSPEIIPSCSE